MKVLRNIFFIVILSIFMLYIPRLAGSFADLFDYRSIDPDGAYAWISVHHIFQALVFLPVMVILGKVYGLDFGFHWGDKSVGRKITLKFFLYFTIYNIGAYAFILLANGFEPFQFPLSANNILGYMGFQLFLSGPSEELIFRAFAITLFALVLKSSWIKGHVSAANILAAIIFAMAHMRFSFAPFEVSFITMQLVLAFGLGIFYGICYEKSGSMYYPMMMHSFSNVMMVGTTIILSFILQ